MLKESDKLIFGLLKTICPTVNGWKVNKNSFESIVYQYEFESFFKKFEELVGNSFYQKAYENHLMIGVTKSTLKQIIIKKLSENNTMDNTKKIDRFVKKEDRDYDRKRTNAVFVQDNLRLMKLSPYDHYGNDICIFSANTQSKEANHMICDKIIDMLNNDEDSILTLIDSESENESDE